MGLGKKQELSSGKAKDSKHKVFLHFSRQKSRRGKEEETKTPSKRSSRRSEYSSCPEQFGLVTPEAQEQQQSNTLNSPCPSKRQSKLERSLVYSRNPRPGFV